MKFYRSSSSAETRALGTKTALKVLRTRPKGAAVAALSGPLGSGKTTFIQGFFKGLKIRRRALSPTFILIRRMPLSGRKFQNLFHVDAYRLMKPKEVLRLDLKDILLDPKSVVVVEWADKIKRLLPEGTLWVTFDYGLKKNERVITFKSAT